MIIIEKNGISGFFLDTNKEFIDLEKAKSEGLFLEFQENKLITISFRDQEKFIYKSASDKRIFSIEKFIEEFDFILDGDNYLFEELNINIYKDYSGNYEFLMFSDSISDNYKIDKNNYKDTNSKVIIDSINLIPYESINAIPYGISHIDFINKVGKPVDHGALGFPKLAFYYRNFTIRFDNNKFSQMLISNPKSVFIETIGMDINTEEGFSEIISNYEVIRNRVYYVFPDLGISIYKEKGKPKEFYLFDKDLLKFWKNTQRPITSW